MRSTALRFSLFTSTAFAALGVYMPYWPNWLDNRGMGAPEIGILMSALLWSRALSGPLIAHFADASGRRRPWIIATAIASAATFACFAWAHAFFTLFAISIAFGIAQACSIPLAENLMLLLEVEGRLSYGKLRAWGSFAFLVGAIVAGRWIDQYGAGLVQPLTFALFGAGAVAAFALPEATQRVRSAEPHFPLRALLARRPLMCALIGCGIEQGSHATYTAFSTLHWKQAGHSMTTIGALWAEGVLAEIVLFTFAKRVMQRFDPRTLLALGVAGSALRWIALGLSTDIAVLVGTQWMHALSFAAVHLALMSYLSRGVPHEMSATAQSLYSTFTQGSTALVVIAAGFVYEQAPGSAFTLMSAVALTGGLLAWLGMARREELRSTFEPSSQ
jgi:PPP family 3-phenylpropionic acid transporter